MKFSRLLIVSIAFLSVSCGLLSKSYDTLDEAKDGMEQAVEQLPQLDSFETIKINQRVFSHTAYGLTCNYARASIAVGSSLPAPDALDQYVEALQAQGWTLTGTQYQQTKSLVVGSNSLVVIHFGYPAIELKDEIDLDELNQTYQSILYIRVDYMLPTRDEC
jgi:hypothetical protein